MSEQIKRMIQDDPFIYNIFSNDTKHTFSQGNAMNWIKVQSSFLSENGNDASISMLSVYTYKGEECSQISKAITNPLDIVFSEEGHVAVNFAKNTSYAEFFYPNPTVRNRTGGTYGTRPLGLNQTVGMQNSYYKTSFYSNENYLFSQNLQWILYKLPGQYYSQDKEGIWKLTQNASGSNVVPAYVLLYNPVHRRTFQSVYGKIINLTGNPFSTQSFGGAPNTSYMTAIQKYCNAFKVKGLVSPNTGEQLEHYADPGCVLMFDTEVAKLSQTLAFNLTAGSWKGKFYKDGLVGYNAAVKDLSAVPVSDAYCARGSGGGPSRFLREKARVVRANADSASFLQILTNYQIASSGEDSGASFPSGYLFSKPGDTTKGAVCGEKSLSFVDCSVAVTAQGELNLNENNIRPVCGNTKTEPEIKPPLPPPPVNPEPPVNPNPPVNPVPPDPTVPPVDPTNPPVPPVDPPDVSFPDGSENVFIISGVVIAVIMLALFFLFKKK